MDARTLELALKIADDAARGVLLMETLPASDGDGWMDLANVPEEARESLGEALEYLELRGLLFYKEGTRSVVRFTEPARVN